MKRLLSSLLVLLALALSGPHAASGSSVTAPQTDPTSPPAQQSRQDTPSSGHFRLSSGGPWGGQGDVSIDISKGIATLTYKENSGRTKTRQLTQAEVENFLDFIQDNDIDSLKNLGFHNVHDGIEYKYSHSWGGSVKSISMNNPSYYKENPTYGALVRQFRDLLETGEYTVSYSAKNVTLLIPEEEHRVASIRGTDGVLDVLLREEDGSLVWHEFDGKTVGGVVSDPSRTSTEDYWGDMEELKKRADGLAEYDAGHHNNYPWQVTWGEYRVRIMERYSDERCYGLWLTQKGEEPILISQGVYASPVVSPEGDWVICARADGSWAPPNDIVRINLNTFEEQVIDIEPAEDLWPVTVVGDQVLIARSEEWGGRAENFLYNAALDTFTPVSGDIYVLGERGPRFLQPTGKPNEYYATEIEYSPETVIVGKYDLSTFTFTPLVTFSEFTFSSMSMWVDEPNARIYVVKNGDLLELPFAAENPEGH